MSQPVSLIDRTVNETNVWMKEIGNALNTDDRQSAYHALREVLIVLRDTMLPDEACDMASQLPTLVRGIFFEGYKPAHKPEPKRHAEDFVGQVSARLKTQKQDVDAEAAVRAVFGVLQRHLSEGQCEQVRKMLHKEVQALWPAGVHSS